MSFWKLLFPFLYQLVFREQNNNAIFHYRQQPPVILVPMAKGYPDLFISDKSRIVQARYCTGYDSGVFVKIKWRTNHKIVL